MLFAPLYVLVRTIIPKSMTAARIDTDINISDTQWHGSKKQFSDLPDHAKGLVHEQLEIPPTCNDPSA